MSKACFPARGLLYISLARVSLWFCSGHRGTIFFYIYLSLYLWVDGSFAFVNPWRPSPLPSLLGGGGACAPPRSHSADAVLCRGMDILPSLDVQYEGSCQ